MQILRTKLHLVMKPYLTLSDHLKLHNTLFWGTENPRDTASGIIGPYFLGTETGTSGSNRHKLQSYAIDHIPLIVYVQGYFQLDGVHLYFARPLGILLDEAFRIQLIFAFVLQYARPKTV